MPARLHSDWEDALKYCFSANPGKPAIDWGKPGDDRTTFALDTPLPKQTWRSFGGPLQPRNELELTAHESRSDVIDMQRNGDGVYEFTAG